MKMGASNNLMSSIFTSRAPTVKGLQNILQHIGGATSGRKDALQGRILHAVKSPVTLIPKKETKILSIDMGIRNLAYCVANVSSPSSLDDQCPATMDILAWRRLDLTEEAWKHSNSSIISPPVSPSDETEGANEDAQETIEEDQDLFSPKNLSSTAFSLVRALLKHEPDIILIERQRWRSSGSSAIQQWTVRVNSLEAMLWAMFTAVRETPAGDKSNGRKDTMGKFTVCSVDPKRVGNYWLDSMGMNTAPSPSPPTKTSKKRSSKSSSPSSDISEDPDIYLETDSTSSTTTTTTKAPPRAKAEKKAKINILRTWLDSSSPSTALLPTQQRELEESEANQPLLSRPDIRFQFTRKSKTTQTTTTETNEDEEDPVTARETLLRTTQPSTPAAKKAKAKKGDSASAAAAKKAPKGAKERKVDDITDCFLQAAAYVAWQMSLGELKGIVARAEAEAVAGGGDGGGSVEGEKKVVKTRKKRVAKKVEDVR